MTYLELVATATILMILASAILPLGRTAHRRAQELELRRALRDIRTAINEYKALADENVIENADAKAGGTNYPPELERLVEGARVRNRVDAQRRMKFLRRIPVDPMTGKAEWGLRCYQDEPDSRSWCGDDVFDVHSKSTGKALDGTTYDTW